MPRITLFCAISVVLLMPTLASATVYTVTPQDDLVTFFSGTTFSDGDEVVLDPGTYYLSTSIDLTGINVLIRSTNPTDSSVVDSTVQVSSARAQEMWCCPDPMHTTVFTRSPNA